MSRSFGFLVFVTVLVMALTFGAPYINSYMTQVAAETAPSVPTATVTKLAYSPPMGSIQPNYYVTVQGIDTKTNKETTLRYDVRPALYEKLHEGDVVNVADLTK